MITRPLNYPAVFTGNSPADDLAAAHAGTEQHGIPAITYGSAPGFASYTMNIAHPDGGYAWGHHDFAPRTK